MNNWTTEWSQKLQDVIRDRGLYGFHLKYAKRFGGSGSSVKQVDSLAGTGVIWCLLIFLLDHEKR